MTDSMKKIYIPGLVCNIVTFFTVFFAIPFMCSGAESYVCTALRIAFAAGIMYIFKRKYHSIGAVDYFLISIVQDGLSLIFEKPLSIITGAAGHSPAGGYELFGQVYLWVMVIIIVQIGVIFLTNIKNSC